ncbi:MAG: hypothetical protein GWN31_08725 [Candidatus Thorarchaeota archaeon]|nr:hypothetical protein [Candidatus Thorarchaeota archaeon]NIW14000.1 hypothetical protein [Candidatus Thorarchaeota archaeon]
MRRPKQDEEKDRHERFMRAISEIAERKKKEKNIWIPKMEPGMPFSEYMKRIFTSGDFWKGFGKEAVVYVGTFVWSTALFYGIFNFMASRGGRVEDSFFTQPITIPQIPLTFPNVILFLSIILGAALTLTFPVDRIPDLFKRIGEKIDLEYALKNDEEEKSKS